MAFTKLYLTNQAAGYTPATLRGAWDDTVAAVTKALDPIASVGGPITFVQRAETNGAANFDVLLYRGVSGPLAAQTISGTLDVVLGVGEANAAADFAFHVHVYVTQGNSDTPRGTLLSDYLETTANEWPTGGNGQGKAFAAAQTLASLAISAGDRLVVEIGYVALNAVTTSYNGWLYYGTIAANGLLGSDLTAGSTATDSRPGFLSFSASITEQEVAGRVSAAPSLVTVGGSGARVSAAPALVTTQPRATARVSAAMVLVTTPPPLLEDGVVPGGTNPPAASLPSSTPQFFGVLEAVDTGTIIETHGESEGGPFADDPDWFGGEKAARVLSFGTLTRKASTPAGGIQVSTQRVVLNDADRALTSTWSATKRRGRKFSTYVVEHATRLAKGQPFRLGAGIVTDHRPGDDFTYELTVQGALGRHMARLNRSEAMVPPSRLTPDLLPALLSTKFSDGWSPPIGYGFLDDESSASPQGVVPGQYVGTTNLQTIFGVGAVNILADFYVFFGHAVQDTLNLYFTPPGWTASTPYLVGDVVRPNLTSNGYLYRCTVAGTSGGSAPAWSTTIGATFSDGGVTWIVAAVDNPELRYPVPASAYGQVIADPHMPGWAAVTGSATPYVDWNGYRLHVAVVRNDHRFAKSLREGRMTLSGNFRGIEDVGDGTGALITAPSRIFQHFWSNFVERTWKTGAWFGPATFGGYSVFDTTTVEAVHDYTNTLIGGGPVRASILIGAGGTQMTLFEAAKQMASSWDLLLGENRHGQIVVGMDNPSAAAVATFTQDDDIVRVTSGPRALAYANVVRYRYGYRWVPPVATQLEGEQGQPMPAKSVHEHAEWVSGLVRLPNTTAIADNNGEEVYLDLDFYGVRDAATALALAQRVLDRAVGPSNEGPVDVLISTGLQGLNQGGTAVDLLSVVGVQHIQGVGASGYAGARVVVESVDVDPDTCTVTLTGRLRL